MYIFFSIIAAIYFLEFIFIVLLTYNDTKNGLDFTVADLLLSILVLIFSPIAIFPTIGSIIEEFDIKLNLWDKIGALFRKFLDIKIIKGKEL